MIAENLTEDMAPQMDAAETMPHSVNETVKSTSGIRLSHILTGAAIVGLIVLFLRGNKLVAIGCMTVVAGAMWPTEADEGAPAGRAGPRPRAKEMVP